MGYWVDCIKFMNDKEKIKEVMSILGKRGNEKKFKGMSAKQRSEYMDKVRQGKSPK